LGASAPGIRREARLVVYCPPARPAEEAVHWMLAPSHIGSAECLRRRDAPAAQARMILGRARTLRTGGRDSEPAREPSAERNGDWRRLFCCAVRSF